MAEIAIIGADIQEVLGTAIALNILFGLEMWVAVLLQESNKYIDIFTVTICSTFFILLSKLIG